MLRIYLKITPSTLIYSYAEFLSENHTKYPDLFNRIIPGIKASLDERGQAVVDAWMAEKGRPFNREVRQIDKN